MGRLIKGEWHTDADLKKSDSGEFEREETTFRDRIEADPDAEFSAEAGRYHLYVSLACPWAHRTLITRKLKGLEDAISVSVVDPIRIDQGWEFAPEKPGCTEDPFFGAEYLRAIYVQADPEYTGRVTVPVLWDKKSETIVNNESAEIVRMFDIGFDGVATRDVDLYPEDLREQIDETIESVYHSINNGVYRAGFADTQEAYDEAVTDLFDALDHWNEVLADQRYLCGSRLTEADVCMFPTLFRFDAVYHTHFKCNVRQIREYDHLWNYAKDIYQTDGVAETCNLDHVTEHYYRSHASLNPKRIVPKGPEIDFTEPHDRDRLLGELPEALAATDATLD